MMVALRSHYSLDMISSVIFAHYIWIMAERYSYLVDWYIFGIPLQKRLQVPKDAAYQGTVGQYFLTCKNCSHPMSNFMVNEASVEHA